METLTNFCLDPFISHLFSSSVSADGYAPNNLTSTNTQIKTRGFRVEHFIRPPVSIEFVFKVPVHVACILLKPDLEDNSEARFAFTGSSHTASQKPNSAADGYEFTLHSGVVAKGPNVVVHLKNRAYDRMWYHNIDISSETVSMVTGSYLNNDLNGAHIIEQPVKHLNIASRLRQLKVTVTRLSGIKPFALKCIEVWGTLTGTSNHSEKVAFHSALECLEANPHSTVPQLSLGVFNHHSLLPLDGVEQRQPNGVIAPNDLHKVQDNSVSSSVTPPNCFPLSALTCGTLEQHIQSKPCHSQSSIHANRPTSTANNLTTKLSVVKPGLIETLPHYQRPYGKRGSTFPQASGYYNTKKPKMEASVTVPAEDSLKPLTCVGHTSTSSGCEEYKLNSNHNSAPHSKCINCNIIPNWKQTNSCHHSDSTLNDECTPSKFLDSITYDVMLLPMLLPSGHYVDRSTIDKLAINDTLYGRPPTDPFTGVAFSESCQPEFCPQLKIEIDAYLITSRSKGIINTIDFNSEVEHTRDEIAGGRTVGNAKDISKHLKTSQNNTFGVINKSHPASCGVTLRTDPVEDPSCAIQQYSTAVQQGYDYISPTSRVHKPVDRKLEHVSEKEKDISCSFENEVSGSLDKALHQLFSS